MFSFHGSLFWLSYKTFNFLKFCGASNFDSIKEALFLREKSFFLNFSWILYPFSVYKHLKLPQECGTDKSNLCTFPKKHLLIAKGRELMKMIKIDLNPMNLHLWLIVMLEFEFMWLIWPSKTELHSQFHSASKLQKCIDLSKHLHNFF